jgi:hypothetical protein
LEHIFIHKPNSRFSFCFFIWGPPCLPGLDPGSKKPHPENFNMAVVSHVNCQYLQGGFCLFGNASAALFIKKQKNMEGIAAWQVLDGFADVMWM